MNGTSVKRRYLKFTSLCGGHVCLGHCRRCHTLKVFKYLRHTYYVHVSRQMGLRKVEVKMKKAASLLCSLCLSIPTWKEHSRSSLLLCILFSSHPIVWYCTLLLGGLWSLQLLWVCHHPHLPSATLLSSFLLSCPMLILLGFSDENTVSLFLSFPLSHPLLFLPSFLSVKQKEHPFLLHEKLLCFFSTLLICLFTEDRIGITRPGFWFWLCLSSLQPWAGFFRF